jgi:cellulose synthase/poly-beta-1,6-N-acetylglucosamine synthase-like glycosyltransferase
LGYGIVLYVLVKLKELFVKPVKRSLPASDADLPEVTLFITAFNEEDVVDEKMENSLELDYPADKLHIVWVTDGSDDGTNERPVGRGKRPYISNRSGKVRRLQ